MSSKIWQIYLKAAKLKNCLVTISNYPSPVTAAFSYVEEKIPDVKLNGDRVNRLPGNANFSFKYVDGEELLLDLDAKGIAASSGSACSSGTDAPSHVLLAIGLTAETAKGALRITMGEENTKEDIDYLVSTLTEIVRKIRKN